MVAVGATGGVGGTLPRKTGPCCTTGSGRGTTLLGTTGAGIVSAVTEGPGFPPPPAGAGGGAASVVSVAALLDAEPETFVATMTTEYSVNAESDGIAHVAGGAEQAAWIVDPPAVGVASAL